MQAVKCWPSRQRTGESTRHLYQFPLFLVPCIGLVLCHLKTLKTPRPSAVSLLSTQRPGRGPWNLWGKLSNVDNSAAKYLRRRAGEGPCSRLNYPPGFCLALFGCRGADCGIWLVLGTHTHRRRGAYLGRYIEVQEPSSSRKLDFFLPGETVPS